MKRKFTLFSAVITVLLTALTIINPALVLAQTIEPSQEKQIKAAQIYVDNKLKTPHKDNVFFVKYKKGITPEVKKSTASSIKAQDLTDTLENPILEKNNISIIKAGDEQKLKDLMTKFKLDPNVESVHLNTKFKAASWTRNDTTKRATPGDYDTEKHWYYDQIKLPEAFYDQGCGTANNQQCGGTNEPVVAVLDSGLAFATMYKKWYTTSGQVDIQYYQASEIDAQKLWRNENEWPSVYWWDGDGDDNDFCGDEIGVDIIEWVTNILSMEVYPDVWTGSHTDYCKNDFRQEGYPNDDDGHGTAVTSIISSITDNSSGTSLGIAPDVKIMPVKVLDYTGSSDLLTVYVGMYYAIAEGADIINMSLEGDDPEGLLRDVIRYAKDRDVLIVAASGNGNTTVSYPARYSLEFDNVLAVGAVNPDGTKSSYSNYGTSLDIVAPVGDEPNGVWQQTYIDIDLWDENVDPTNRDFTTFSHKTMAGTSFAPPQVSAAAALMLSLKPTLKPSQIKSILRSSATKLNGGYNQYTGYGLLNVQKALTECSSASLVKTVVNPSATGDNLTDIIAFNPTTKQINVTPSTGANFGGGYKGYQVWNSNSGYSTKDWKILKPGDVDGDGDLDIIAFNTKTTQIDVTLSNGSSFGGGYKGYRVWNSRSGYSATSWTLLDPADVNGDGKVDIIAFNKSTKQLDVTPSTGTNFGGGYKGYQVWNTNSAYSVKDWELLSPTDVNGDKKADIIARNKSNNSIDVTLSNGSKFGGGYKGYQIWNANPGMPTSQWKILDPADINGDFKADIIAWGKKTGQIVALTSNGSRFGADGRSILVNNSGLYYPMGYNLDWTFLSPRDINGDQSADIIAINGKGLIVAVTSQRSGIGVSYISYRQDWNSRSGYTSNQWKILD